ncbi:MAG: YbgA family protein, partial [Victivallaceae bacterium]|nr:YbgA family protein [Victivallaceae bacterium]
YKVTPKKNRNVMMHLMGYFKKNLSSAEKQEVLELMDHYVDGLLPLLAPLTMLRHYSRKYDCEFLQNQYYLNPSSAELNLKYHL